MSSDTMIPSEKQSLALGANPAPNPHKNKRTFSAHVMVNTTLTLSWIVILTFGISVTLISYFSGSKGLDLIIRSGSAVLIASLVFWFLSSTIIKGSREIAKKYQEEEKQEQEQELKSGQHIREIQA